ncbi:TolC family protein [Acidobacteriota bacterium]
MKKTWIFLFCLAATRFLCSQVPMEKALAEGIRLNLTVQNQNLNVDSQKLALVLANLNRRFSLDFGSSYRFQSQKMEIEIPGASPVPGVTIPGQNISVGTKHIFDLNLSFKQPLFTGSILKKAVESEEIRLAVEKNTVALRKLDIVSEIKTSYFNHQFLKNKRKTLETLIKKLGIHYKKQKSLFAEELVRKSDLLETAAGIQEKKIQLEDLDHLIRAEKIQFQSLCGLDLDKIESNYIEPERSFDKAMEDFVAFHPVIRTLDNNLSLIDTSKAMIKGRSLPQVSAVAELHFGKPGIDYFRNEWSLYFIGGIQIGLQLFNWNKDNMYLKGLDFNQKKIQNQKEDFIRTAEKQLRQLFDRLEVADNKLVLLDGLLDTTREDIRLKEELLQEQQISNLDFLASLTSEESFLFKKNEMFAQRELVKLNINTITGVFKEAQ